MPMIATARCWLKYLSLSFCVTLLQSASLSKRSVTTMDRCEASAWSMTLPNAVMTSVYVPGLLNARCSRPESFWMFCPKR